MGLIISELQVRKPELPYVDDSYTREYPVEAPFTLSELEEIYPTASGKSKVDEEFKAKALQATADLQKGKPGYRAIWKHIMELSIADLKKNYEKLKVDFDLWYGESDSQKYIPDMVEKMKKDGFAYISNGALIVDVATEEDKKEIPPCIILKSDGAAMYDTTDLATILQRTIDFAPDSIIYVVDKRQELHFEQVFRCARKTGQVAENTELKFLGFGTMNGKDGKPFKTRDGGVMRLSSLISQITDQMYEKISGNEALSQEEAKETAQVVALAALKYGDLSNQASKDYIFDIDKFISFDFERRGIGVAFHHVENVIFARLERKQARPVFDDVIADVFFKTPYVFHIKFFEARFFKHFRAVFHGVISSVRFIQKFFYVHKYVLNVL